MGSGSVCREQGHLYVLWHTRNKESKLNPMDSQKFFPPIRLWPMTSGLPQVISQGQVQCRKWKVKVKLSVVSDSCDPMNYRVHGILQARILEWVAISFSRGSSQPRDQTQVSHIAGRFFTSHHQAKFNVEISLKEMWSTLEYLGLFYCK